MRYFIALLLLITVPTLSRADTPHQVGISTITQWPTVGSGTYEYLFLDLYTAKLQTPNGKYDASAPTPLSLTLTYHKTLKGKKIAKVSIEQMQKSGCQHAASYDNWQTAMGEAFPDVNDGEYIAGVWQEDGTTSFYHEGKLTKNIADKNFGECFFGIWLNEETTAPKLRTALLGE